ncbi:MAG: MFS domain-containing histidine kinase [Myxococcota bacterium]
MAPRANIPPHPTPFMALAIHTGVTYSARIATHRLGPEYPPMNRPLEDDATPEARSHALARELDASRTRRLRNALLVVLVLLMLASLAEAALAVRGLNNSNPYVFILGMGSMLASTILALVSLHRDHVAHGFAFTILGSVLGLAFINLGLASERYALLGTMLVLVASTTTAPPGRARAWSIRVVALWFVLMGGRMVLQPDYIPVSETQRAIYMAVFTIIILVTRTMLLYMNDDMSRTLHGVEIQRARTMEINTELQQARDALLASAASRAAFFATVTHELRTPLTAVLGYTELIQESIHDHESTLEDLGHVHHAAQHMLRLINDLLDLSRLDAGKLELHIEDVDTADVLRHLAETAEPLASARHNTLSLEVDPVTLHTDATRLYQVLLNLISNACKFTERGTITIRATSEGALATFEVEDTGVGIPPEHLDSIFEAFAQASNSHAGQGASTGLGLAIARQLTRALGGDVIVSSTLGEGSVFRVVLPIKAPPVATEASGSGSLACTRR